MKVGVVVNPVAGNGRMNALWPEIHGALGDHFSDMQIVKTDAPGDAIGIARDLALDGKHLVIAAGGDGTVSETVDGLLQARESGGPVAELGIMTVGTGSDLARGLGIEGSVSALARRIAEARVRPVDAGRVAFIDDHGALHTRHFINIASLGVSGTTDRAVNAAKSGGRMSGKMVFLWHTVRELIRYRFQNVRITVDDGEPVEATIALVACANGRYFGGGMMIAPDASINDGQLEVIVVRGVSKLKLIADLRLVYSGAHRTLGSCTFMRGKKISVEPLGDALVNGALLDVDGESPGRIPATFEILPSAIRVRY
ncbi:MAG TPA: diacylglycerol kinase family protein [Rhizobiaceae bacterium]|nr:diacylglycerol kinase family protein [Rhizobiaceae bacterium]